MSDSPATQDRLSIKSYTDALAEFVNTCGTPMTVAIQGDWGSGKTSLMQMVEERLESSKCKVISFNTWQYAQFQMGDELVLALMEHLIDSIGLGEKDDKFEVRNLRKGLRAALFSLAGTFGNVAIDELSRTIPLGQVAIKAGREATRAATSAYQESLVDTQFTPTFRGRTLAIESLRQNLQRYVAAALDSDKKTDRLVIMIDDLDRLPPQRAVEVMEAIKVFLDVTNCVYVLAIDFDVVKEGVRYKFGEQFDERKAVAFFDKIIQVPFHMPVSAYNVDEFIIESLRPLVDTKSPDKDLYIKLTKESVGKNPRSLKRLANIFHLLSKLDLKGRDTGNAPTGLQLFATLCMQSSMPLYYQEFEAQILPLLEEGVDDQQTKIRTFFESQIEGFDPETVIKKGIEDASTDETSTNLGDRIDHNSQERHFGLVAGNLREQHSLSNPEAAQFSKFIESFRQVFQNRSDPVAASDSTTDDDSDREVDFIDAPALEQALLRAAVTSMGSGSKPVDHQGSISYGWDSVIQELRNNVDPADQRPIDVVEKIVDNLQRELPVDQFDVGLSSDKQRILFYVDNKKHSRGTMCDIRLGKSMIRILFGAHYLQDKDIEEWRSEAEKHHFEVGKNTTASYQIVLTHIRQLDDSQLNALTRWLVAAQKETRKKFFPNDANS